MEILNGKGVMEETAEDVFNNIIYTADGNYLVLGTTSSNDGDVSGHHGSPDIWLLKIDRNGNILWQKCLGGSHYEYPGNIRLKKDAGFYFIGATSSNDGDVSGNYVLPNLTRRDVWILKLDSEGSILTQKCFGGSLDDEGFDIVEGPNNTFFMAAQILSDDGDFQATGNGPRGYLFRIDSLYGVIWSRGFQRTWPIQLMQKGNYFYANFNVVACVPNLSNFGANHLSFPVNGMPQNPPNLAIYATNCFSGIDLSGYHTTGPTGIDVINENDIVFAGGGDDTIATPGFRGGGFDGFIAGAQAVVGKKWKRFVGGSGTDEFVSVTVLNEFEFLAAGYSNSNNGDVSGNHGDSDFWIVKFGKVNSIKGTVYADYNLNGTKDVNEPFVNKIVVESKKGNKLFWQRDRQ